LHHYSVAAGFAYIGVLKSEQSRPIVNQDALAHGREHPFADHT
jgi:hypothetical protein